jgi:predicted component of type VI protein secretion system
MRKTFLDPLLAGALQMEQLPVVSSRADMVHTCEKLTQCIESISGKCTIEPDREAAQQLANIGESLAACVISLMAYTRGRSPKVASKKPNTTIIQEH